MSGAQVVGLGLCTPVGTSTHMTLASLRAGLVRFSRTEVLDEVAEPVRASRLSLLDTSLSRTQRMAALARQALAGVRPLLASLPPGRVPLYLGLPEAGLGARVEQEALVPALLSESEGRLEVVKVHESGRAAFFEALASAQKDLHSGRAGALALVGAVDSLADGASLEALAAARLHLGRRNPDGRIPGEAAGFVALARPGAPKSLKLEATGVLLGTALAVEPRPFLQRGPSLAEGLTEVLHTLRRDAVTGARRVDAALACQPGDSFWSTEFSRAYLRNAALLPEPLRVHVAGEGLGDAGAGAGPVMLGVALHRARWHQPSARRTLVYGSADGGRIGACVVEMIRSTKEEP
ncbi:3-oxoacyl-ACP synthase [Vitiosangium sp. GDMCC 1.1324]|uniref:3-oxoacyl-ACP synthase n=1 Tax=Vitiosangium sp. (strain GDMCC 1.1324) TaxID=2138576 RepID=UPI000D33F2B2|nr:3-oxoacyl-ACP synthase [Vitiosangium sp. GDMCC 1.1324]PTL79927.1 3-oxoacyl-ACP synthase [Vitiosangium sp. GDMCC 1.1324]